MLCPPYETTRQECGIGRKIPHVWRRRCVIRSRMAADVRAGLGLILTFALIAVAAMGCGGTTPASGTTNSPPPPRAGAASCPPSAAETSFLQRLEAGGIKVTAASGSTGEGLLPKATRVCLMDVGKDSFEVAFFADSATAHAVHVCETPSGSRYLYQLEERTIDAAYPLYWSVSAATLIWTTSSGLDGSLRQVLKGVRPLC